VLNLKREGVHAFEPIQDRLSVLVGPARSPLLIIGVRLGQCPSVGAVVVVRHYGRGLSWFAL
jgi:hypothetical protein